MKNYSGEEFVNKAQGFDEPTQLPKDSDQQAKWQAANKAWWEATPMRYDWREKISAEPGTEFHYREIDARFLSSVRKYLPWKKLPFEQLIPFADLRSQDVLEIGTGQGTHAQLIAPHCKSFTGIDLTTASSDAAARRLAHFKIDGSIHQMDAEKMAFADNSFDFIWSWGVIHHSANTRQILREMNRVLRPGGNATVMVYHRSWWYYYVGGTLRGLFRKKIAKGNLHAIAQGSTDGAIARYYTPAEWRAVAGEFFAVDAIRIYGLKVELLPLPPGRLKAMLEKIIPDGLSRLLLNRARLGSFLVAQMHKA